MTQYLYHLVELIGANPSAALLIVFLVSMGEALFVIGLFIPSTVVLIGAGTLIGTGKLSFLPIFTAATSGAIAGDAISYWFGHYYKEHVRQIWPFSRYTSMLDNGEIFFARHGGKSVFIGRFIPGVKAVVPGIAGIVGMNPWRFSIINIVSAIAWSLSHLLPGMLVGRAVGIGALGNPRMLELTLVSAVLLVIAWYATKMLVLWLLPHMSKWRDAIVRPLAKRPNQFSVFFAKLLVNEDGIFMPFALGTAISASLIGFAVLLFELLFDPTLARSDAAISAYLQTTRTPIGDDIMIAVTMLGDGVVLLPIAAAVVIGILWNKQWKLAASVAIAFTSAALFVPLMKSLVQRARPISLYQGADSFSFPSGHATLSATVIGIVLLLAAHRFSQKVRVGIYVSGSMLVSLIALSRLYLQAHWPSDVAAGLLFGGSLVFMLAWLLHNKPIRAVSSVTGIIVLVTISLIYPLHFYNGYAAAEAKYAAKPILISLSKSDWISNPWAKLPQDRILLNGDTGEPLFLQTNLAQADIVSSLTNASWQLRNEHQLQMFVDALLPSKDARYLKTPLPSTNSGQPALAIFTKPIDGLTGAIWVLRFWETATLSDAQSDRNRVLSASIEQQVRDPLPLGYSLPERAAAEKVEINKLSASIIDILSKAIPNITVSNSNNRFVIAKN